MKFELNEQIGQDLRQLDKNLD